MEKLQQFYGAMEQCRLAYVQVYQGSGISDPSDPQESVKVNDVREAVRITLAEQEVRA